MRIPPRPEIGLVVSYAYLWADEFDTGRREGVKDRPAAIVLARADLGPAEIAYVVPVTHTPPLSGSNDRVEIPPDVKRRLGLDDARSWIVVSELNVFVWPGPDLRPITDPKRQETDCAYGYLPPNLFQKVQEAMLAEWRKGRIRTVKRGG